MRSKAIALVGCASALLLSGCASTRSIDVTAKPVELNIIQPADPEPVSMADVKVKVVTASNMEEFIAEAKKQQGTENPVFVMLTMRDYESLSLNVAELKRYIKQQQQIILYYKKATAPSAPQQVPQPKG